jgi:hypothetical protein
LKELTQVLKTKFACSKILFDSLGGYPTAVQPFGNRPSGVRARKGIKHDVTFIGQEPHEEVWKRRWKTSRVNLNSGLFTSESVIIIRGIVPKLQELIGRVLEDVRRDRASGINFVEA